jgi:hypothetical protein
MYSHRYDTAILSTLNTLSGVCHTVPVRIVPQQFGVWRSTVLVVRRVPGTRYQVPYHTGRTVDLPMDWVYSLQSTGAYYRMSYFVPEYYHTAVALLYR